ncbi:MAG TPA: glucose 1-dehydrogenase [Bryobacteraceae bacterium]|jgi:NAD(P)-dependent dehydrogenase (short-subunit alcohol dehydrogenase family)|nr:glucose 1-dehydrogenase [Bryobacteraceae bacterium]
MPKINFTDLTGRVAVVTGGTSGIGRELAIGLAEAGADVVPTGRRESLLSGACADIRSAGVKTLEMACDVSDRGSVDALRDAVLAEFGQIDILVNSAGATAKRPTIEVDEEEWNRILNVNLTGILRTCQSLYQPLAANKRGRIVNIASIGAFSSLFQVAAYNSSKAGVVALTKTLAIEWGKDGINTNAIAPGVFRTEMNERILDGTERGREYKIRTPMGRFGRTRELVGAAVLLASDSASFINGATIPVDGGFLASGVNS